MELRGEGGLSERTTYSSARITPVVDTGVYFGVGGGVAEGAGREGLEAGVLLSERNYGLAS